MLPRVRLEREKRVLRRVGLELRKYRLTFLLLWEVLMQMARPISSGSGSGTSDSSVIGDVISGIADSGDTEKFGISPSISGTASGTGFNWTRRVSPLENRNGLFSKSKRFLMWWLMHLNHSRRQRSQRSCSPRTHKASILLSRLILMFQR